MATLTRHDTDQAVDFIGRNKDRPFFLYLAHSMPHIPLAAGKAFRGKTGSPYGDVIQESDASTGEELAAFDRHLVEDRSLGWEPNGLTSPERPPQP